MNPTTTKNKVEQVFVVAATNRLDSIDEALVRSGRLGIQLHVSKPDAAQRWDIFKVKMNRYRKKNMLSSELTKIVKVFEEWTETHGFNLDIQYPEEEEDRPRGYWICKGIIDGSDNMSGADIEQVFQFCIQDNLSRETINITDEDIQKSIMLVKDHNTVHH